MPRAARRAVETELDRWATLGVDGHFPDARPARGRARPLRAAHGGWLDYHVQFAPRLADLVGAQRDEVVAMNTLTVNLHLMLATFFRPTAQRYKILIERDAFSSDRYAVESQLRWHGLDPRTALLEVGFREGSFELDRARYEALLAEQGESIALVLLPGVQYLTGERLDLAAYAAAAQRYGCRVGFDLAHAIGNVPLAVHDSGADFAVWCSYKYLNAGPGAVAGCFVHRRHGAAREPAAARRLVGARSRAALPHGAEVHAVVRRRGLAGQQPSDPVAGAAGGVARAVRCGRHEAIAAQVRRADALPRVAARARARRPRASADAERTPSGAAVTSPCSSRRLRPTRRRSSRACAPRASSPIGASRTCCAWRPCRSTTAIATSTARCKRCARTLDA